MKNIEITATDGNGAALKIENDEFIFHASQDGMTDKATGRRMSMYAGKYVMAHLKRMGSETITDAEKIARYETFKSEAEKMVYKSRKSIEDRTSDKEVSHGAGWCDKCKSYCFGDCGI